MNGEALSFKRRISPSRHFWVGTDSLRSVRKAQVAALRTGGCEEIYQEKVSGGRRDRPKLQDLLAHFCKCDVGVVWKLDCLARFGRDLRTLMERIHERKAGFRSLTEAIDTKTPSGPITVPCSEVSPSSGGPCLRNAHCAPCGAPQA